jgi:hypothetical protein
MEAAGASAVEEENRIDPVEAPEPIATAETVSVVERENRVVPVAAPTAMTTGGTDAVEETTRIEAVGGGEATDTDGRPDEDEDEAEETILCEYCGRDDFESVPQRNGHLRWCDEYDPNTPDPTTEEVDDGNVDAAELNAERRAVSELTGTEDTVDGEMNQEPQTETKAETLERSETVAGTTDSTDDTFKQTDTDTDTDVRIDFVDSDGSDEADSVEGGDGSGDDDNALEDFAVIGAYVAVRQELQDEFDIDDQRTSREFYHLCRNRGLDEERLAALEQLTQAYEAVQYSDDPEVDVDELRAAAERFEADVLKQSR